MRKPAIALAAVGLLTAFTTVAPASARADGWHHRGWGDHGWHHRDRGWHGDHDDGAAIGLGILGGIVAGAAIASTQAYAPPAYYYQPPAYSYAPAYGYSGYGGYGYYR